MKNRYTLLLLFILFFSNSYSQNFNDINWGVEAGYINGSFATGNSSYGTLITGSSGSINGFFAGANVHINLGQNFVAKPALLYSNTQDLSWLHLPVLIKYYITEQFNFLAGPQLTAIVEEVRGGMNSVGLDLGAGISFDITQNFFLEGRYNFEITDRFSGVSYMPSSISGRYNTFNIGIGYKFQ
ncbi:outer membrane beta-barrel protein [Salegentibacter sp. HM20]